MFIFDFIIFVFNRFFLLHVSNDSNFDTIEFEIGLRSHFKSYRYSLFYLNFGDKQFYIFTFSLGNRFHWFYTLKYEELKPNNFENKVSGVKSKLSTQLNDEIKAKCLSDFFKEKLSQEYTRISYSMSKLTSYRTFLLFLVGAGIALSKLYFELFDFLTTITIFIIYYYYCFSLYHVISSAISVSSINMSSSGDYKWDKCNKDLAITYIYDLVNVRYSADKKVSLVKCAEKYLQMTFLLMMILTSAYFIFDSIKKVTPPNLNNEKSFSIYNNSGEFDLSEFSLFVSKLKNHAGSIYIVHCTQSKKVDDLNTLFSVISVEKIDLIFIETNETNFCNGLTVIHF